MSYGYSGMTYDMYIGTKSSFGKARVSHGLGPEAHDTLFGPKVDSEALWVHLPKNVGNGIPRRSGQEQCPNNRARRV